MRTHTTAQPSPFFRSPACFAKANPTRFDKRTGEFTKPADIATDEVLRRLENFVAELRRDVPKFDETAVRDDLKFLVKCNRTEVEQRRGRDFFGLVAPHAREGGSGYLATCIIEDRLRALLLAVAERPNDYPPSFTQFLCPTPERVEKCMDALTCFSDEQICRAAQDFCGFLGTPGVLAKMMRAGVLASISQGTISPSGLGLSGNWRKFLREGLVRRLNKVRKRLGQCGCGCGGVPKTKKARFMPGHDGKLRGRHIREARGGG